MHLAIACDDDALDMNPLKECDGHDTNDMVEMKQIEAPVIQIFDHNNECILHIFSHCITVRFGIRFVNMLTLTFSRFGHASFRSTE